MIIFDIVGAMMRNVGVKPTVFMTGSVASVTSVSALAATSAATLKPYVVAAVVDPSEVRWLLVQTIGGNVLPKAVAH